MATSSDVVAGPTPERASGVELLGELEGSGYVDPPSLVRRADGQVVQITDLLYEVLDCIDGHRDLDQVAELVSERIGRRASTADIAFLVEEKLQPLGLLKGADGSEPAVTKANPLLALRLRIVLSSEQATRRLTAPFAALFWPPVVLAVMAGFAAMVAWLLLAEGLAGSTREVLYEPSLLVVVFAFTALSAGFHEFGHAAACRYGGATPGVMGAGLYLVWPAFYTDVTDSYRLDRRGRLRTDLGGLYFNMVFALAVFGMWAVTRWEPLLLLIPLQLLQMVHQLLPFVRLDGYLILTDLTGVPDLFARIRPTLRSLVPGRAPEAGAAELKRWVRVVVGTWIALVIPVLLLGFGLMAVALPRLVATAWDSAGEQWDAIVAAESGAWSVGAGVLSLAALALPIASAGYISSRLALRIGRAVLDRLPSTPAVRIALGTGALAAIVGLAALWWPNGEYRPIQPGERGRLQDAVAAVRDVPTGRPGLTEERSEDLGGAPDRRDQEAPPATTTEPAPAGPTPGSTTAPAGPASTTASSTSAPDAPAEDGGGATTTEPANDAPGTTPASTTTTSTSTTSTTAPSDGAVTTTTTPDPTTEPTP